jgi:hypothetical protein
MERRCGRKRNRKGIGPSVREWGRAKNGSHRTGFMSQSQTGFLPAHLPGLSPIHRGCSRHPLGHFHHRSMLPSISVMSTPWTVKGANAIIALRCSKLSGRFEDFWERRSDQSKGQRDFHLPNPAYALPQFLHERSR